MDTLSPADRSARMALIKSSNTQPEILVRRIAHALGYRYRLHVKQLPGSPDLVFPSRGKVIFVHGCFWHAHGSRCKVANLPKSRRDYWIEKFSRNKARDRRNLSKLRRDGWKVLVIWECQTRDRQSLQSALRTFLGPSAKGR